MGWVDFDSSISEYRRSKSKWAALQCSPAFFLFFLLEREAKQMGGVNSPSHLFLFVFL